MKFTVLGGSGFIGRNLVTYLKSEGHEVVVPGRDLSVLKGQELGHLVYCIGLTGNARLLPHETIEAHVTLLSFVIQSLTFNSLMYLSSTRVYDGHNSSSTVSEDQALLLNPKTCSIFSISKVLGEALCLQSGIDNVKVIRLANIYGAGQSENTFLGSIIKDLKSNGTVTIGEAPESSKDYLSIEEAVSLMTKIVLEGKHQIYNISSAEPVTHLDLSREFISLGYEVNFKEGGEVRNFPKIDNERIKDEFDFMPRNIISSIKELLKNG